MTKMPEPVGCGYVVRWETGDTASTHKTGLAQVLGANVVTVEQLKQYGRDLLEEAIQRFESRTNVVFSAQRIQEELRKMKEQIK